MNDGRQDLDRLQATPSDEGPGAKGDRSYVCFSFPPNMHPLSQGAGRGPAAMSQPNTAAPLLKQKSWSPDSFREEAWLRRKERWSRRHRRTKSLTDEDLDELKGCIDLGFGFDSPGFEPDQRLSDTLPALGFYCAVNKTYYETVLKSTSSESDLSVSSPVGSPLTVFSPGDDPKTIKTRLRQWAQVVACSVRQSCC